jgi:hypothetical protein
MLGSPRLYVFPSFCFARAVAHVPFSSYDSRWASSSPHELSRDTHVHPAPSAVTPEWQEREESDVICCEKFPPFREDLVKLCEPELSLVCYHYRKGWGRRSVSRFHSLPENSAKAD